MLFKTGKNTFQEIEIKFYSKGKLSEDKSEELFYDADDFEKEGNIYIAPFLDYKRLVDYWKVEVDNFNNAGISVELGETHQVDDEWILYVNGKEFRGF